MRQALALAAILALVAQCDSAPPPAATRPVAHMQTIDSVPPRQAPLDPPPVLQDEAPPPKSETMETHTPIVLSAADEKLRASLPFTPAIAMDPVDGSKISIRASTPTYQYKDKIYYFSSEANRKTFIANPETALKGGYMRL